MMLRRFTFFLFFYSIFILTGIAQQVDWMRRADVNQVYGGDEVVKGFHRDKDGNFYMLMNMQTSTSQLSFFGTTVLGNSKYVVLGKFDSNMNLAWAKPFFCDPWFTSEEIRHNLAIDNAGSIYYADKDTTYKFSSNGNLVWKKPFTGNTIKTNKQGQLEFYQFKNASNTLNGSPILSNFATTTILDTAGNYIRHFTLINPAYESQVILGRNRTGYYGCRIASKVSGFQNSNRMEFFTCDSLGNTLKSGIINYNHYYTPNPINTNLIQAAYDSIHENYYLAGLFRNTEPINKPDSVTILKQRLSVVQLNANLEVSNILHLGNDQSSNYAGHFPFFMNTHNGNLYFASIASRGSVTYKYFTHFGILTKADLDFYNNVVVGKLDRNLNPIWHIPVGNARILFPMPTDSGIYFCGTANNLVNKYFNFPVLSFSDAYILKITDKDSTTAEVSGKIFNDLNQNGVDDNEPGVVGQTISNKTVSGISYSTNNGFYQTTAVTGLNTLHSQSLPKYWVRTTPDSLQVNVPATAAQLNGFNFGMRAVSGIKDAFVSLTPITAARINMPVMYQLTYRNLATDLLSGQIKMVKAPELTYQNASVTPDVISGDTLTWNYANLQPNQMRNIQIKFVLQNNPALVNKYLTSQATITPITGDTATENNITEIYHQVTGPIDPNDIAVSPSCPIDQSFITDGKYLEYRIRFQNIGTDTAFSVVIHDTLSANLDQSTLELVANSHNPRFWIKNNILTIYFENIKLPHNAVNYPGSHGFFTYRIKPKTSISLLASIKNKASIYFDFNKPIHTNEVTTQVTTNNILFTAVPQHINCYGDSTGIITINNNNCLKAPVSYSLDSLTFQNSPVFSQLKAGNYTVFINAGNQFYKLDSVIVQQPGSIHFTAATTHNSCYGDSTGIITINSNICVAAPVSYSTDSITFQTTPVFSQLPAGNYSIWIKAGNLFFKLDSLQVLEPDSIVASITYNHATSGNGDITINATGGTGPYNYTLNGGSSQANNYFGNLSAGTYQVTIRDQNNCSKTYTIAIQNISSVKDDQLTGLKIYPNPFGNKLYIDSKQTLSNARIQLFNSLGQLIFSQIINDRQTFLELKHFPKGMYLLKITSTNWNSSQVVIKN